MVGSISLTGADFSDVFNNMDQFTNFLAKFLRPDFSYIPNLVAPMLATIRMSVAGTFLGFVLALPFSFLATNLVTHNLVVTAIVRFFLNIIRTIPNLLLAALVVAIAGIGELSGVITIAVFTFGMLSQLFYESIEAVDHGPIEANVAVGASQMQVVFWSILPQILSHLASYILYAFEVNIRASAVLGYAGAGGVGVILSSSLALLRHDRVSVVILFILLVVAIVDKISEKIRTELM